MLFVVCASRADVCKSWAVMDFGCGIVSRVIRPVKEEVGMDIRFVLATEKGSGTGSS